MPSNEAMPWGRGMQVIQTGDVLPRDYTFQVNTFDFPLDLPGMQVFITHWATDKGWGGWGLKDTPEKICLIHSELSEALEAYRDGAQPAFIYLGDPEPEGIGIELADTVIRILHYCGVMGIDLEACIKMKMFYNIGRTLRHGGKKA